MNATNEVAPLVGRAAYLEAMRQAKIEYDAWIGADRDKLRRRKSRVLVRKGKAKRPTD